MTNLDFNYLNTSSLSVTSFLAFGGGSLAVIGLELKICCVTKGVLVTSVS